MRNHEGVPDCGGIIWTYTRNQKIPGRARGPEKLLSATEGHGRTTEIRPFVAVSGRGFAEGQAAPLRIKTILERWTQQGGTQIEVRT